MVISNFNFQNFTAQFLVDHRYSSGWSPAFQSTTGLMWRLCILHLVWGWYWHSCHIMVTFCIYITAVQSHYIAIIIPCSSSSVLIFGYVWESKTAGYEIRGTVMHLLSLLMDVIIYVSYGWCYNLCMFEIAVHTWIFNIKSLCNKTYMPVLFSTILFLCTRGFHLTIYIYVLNKNL